MSTTVQPTQTVHAIGLQINGQAVQVEQGSSVAAALAVAGLVHSRRSVSNQPRAALCGMGICQECRVQIDGRVRLACQTLVAPGMQVETVR